MKACDLLAPDTSNGDIGLGRAAETGKCDSVHGHGSDGFAVAVV